MSTMLVEEAVAHRDRFLQATEARRMGPELAAALGARQDTCHVVDAKYEPGVSAIILYSLGDRLVRGDLVTDGEERTGTVVPPGVAISAFPDDPDLPTLALLMDPIAAGRALDRPVTGVELLRYRPGKRATVRVTFDDGSVAVTKAYHDPAKAAAVAEESVALADATRGASQLRFAPTMGHHDALGWVVQGPVSGRPLDTVLGNTRILPDEAHDAVLVAAGALAEFHAARPALRRERSVQRELERFALRASRIATVDPTVGGRAARLAERLVAAADHIPAARFGPVHGDCKPSQFLLEDSAVHLLDLDHVGISDQAADVGTFMATLRQYAVRHRLAGRSVNLADQLPLLAEDFVAAYLDASGDDTQRSRIHWHVAVALERKGLRAFARAPRSPVASALFDEADRCLDNLAESA